MRVRAAVLAIALLLAGCIGAIEPGDVADPDLGPDLVESRLSPTDADAMEVDVDAAPNGSHVVAASNLRGDDHSGFGVYVSWDGGRTWSFSTFEPEDVERGPGRPGFDALSDPVVHVAGDGTVYLSALAYIPTSAIVVAVSDDGGETFPESHVVDESDPATEFNDKEWFDVDPKTGTIVVAWQKEPVIDMLRQVEYETGLDVDVGDVVVSRSTDDGETWSDPVEVDRGMHNNGTQVVVAPDGTWHLSWVNYEENAIDYVRSTDGGQTWSEPTAVADVDVVPPYDEYQRMHTLPGMAAGPDGELVVVWHDDRNGNADAYAVASPDGGETWGGAKPVHGVDEAEQLYPWVDVGPDGRVAVSYYASTAEDPYNLTYVQRTASGVAGDGSLAFGSATSVSASFDVAGRNGLLGDYTGIVATADAWIPAWADGRGDRPAIFAARTPAR